MQEIIVDPRQSTPEELAEGMRQAQTLFKLNHTMPYTDEYNALAEELFGHDVFADGGFVMPGLTGVCFDRVKLGRGVKIMNNCLMMSRGGDHPAWCDCGRERRRGSRSYSHQGCRA